jgi:CBS domain-containing protein
MKGEKMNRHLKDICSFKKVRTIAPDSTIKSAVDILNEYHIGCLVVMDASEDLVGIISERDIMQTLGNTSINDDIHHMAVQDIMTPKEKIVTATADNTLEQLMKVMRDNNIRHIPILDEEGKLTCITSIRDVIRLLLEKTTQKVDHLNNYITGKYPA